MKSSNLFRTFKSSSDTLRRNISLQNLRSSLRSSGNSTTMVGPNSCHAMRGGGNMSVANAASLVAEGYCSGDNDNEHSQRSCDDGSDDESNDDTSSVKDLDGSLGSRTHVLDSNTLLAKLGSSPTTEQIANLAAVKAQEYIVECFNNTSKSLDKEKFQAVPRYVKSDLLIGQFLGKGSFSDAFEVTLTIKIKQEPKPRRDVGTGNNSDGPSDLDAVTAGSGLSGDVDEGGDALKPISLNASNDPVRKPSRRASASHLSQSVLVGTLATHDVVTSKRLAMKCLRPQIRAHAEQFLIGVEDLVHETAILASLDHPNIIKIHGRSGDSVSDSFRLSDGYFILLDRLMDTLEERIVRWKKNPQSKNGPSVNQLKIISCLADAVLFLHQNNICFRDLKPANVGFDDRGILKLFDFGFAVYIDKDEPNSLTEKCGTLRYMAPEVGLTLGYGMEVDVFSFGIMLWEVCALKKPFAKIQSAAEFEKVVFTKDSRPKLKRKWPEALKNLISECWSRDPKKRPTMSVVKSILAASVESGSTKNRGGNSFGKSLRSSITRRVSWD